MGMTISFSSATDAIAESTGNGTDEQLLDEIFQIEDQGSWRIGKRFAEFKDLHPEDWYPRCTAYCEKIGKKPWSRRHITYLEDYAKFVQRRIGTNGSTTVPTKYPKECVVRPLTALPEPDQKRIWDEVKADPTPERIKKARKKYDAEQAQPKTKKGAPSKLTFNLTTDSVDWAKWTWNPVFGCKHGCPYCYARDFAHRQGRDFAKPEMMMHLLSCPKNTQIPKNMQKEPGIKNVFVCSMADLFGAWVPQEWIDMVMNAVRDNPQWTYIFLTKNPERLATVEWPDHCWVGTTVDEQSRVERAEVAFKTLKASVRFLSVEPFNEELHFEHLERFQWLIIGGRSRSRGMPAFQPESIWVERLVWQARKAKCRVYFKPNLEYRPKEWPS